MNKQNSLNLIRDLCNAKGVSGFEDEVIDIVKKNLDFIPDKQEDCMRNLYATLSKKEGAPIVQLDCHTDEVGFIVQAIKPNGCLKILKLGSWIDSNIPAHQVMVRNTKGEYILGITSSTPPHFIPESRRNMGITIEDISVDIGASSKQEAEEVYSIGIGEPVVPYTQFIYQEKNDLMYTKALDNRLGCAAIIDSLKELKDKDLNVNLCATFSSQEEIGGRGAKVSVNRANADICIVFEACPADDTSVEPYLIQTALKHGPMLRYFDVCMLTNPRYQRFALDIAKKHNLSVQTAVRSGGGTNAGIIHTANKGIPCIVIGVPVRYAHTHYGISSYYDYEQAVLLACEIIKALNEDIIKSF